MGVEGDLGESVDRCSECVQTPRIRSKSQSDGSWATLTRPSRESFGS